MRGSGFTERFDAWLFRPVSVARLFVLAKAYLLLLGLDCVVELVAHGGRYGIGGFNVPHFAWLDPLSPFVSPPLYVGTLFVAAGLASTLVFGRLRRPTLVALTVAYTLSWSMSLLDAYQHHYLNTLLLVSMCAMPLPDLADAHDGPPGAGVKQVAAPGYVSLLTTLTVVYAFTALTKLEPDWRSGAALTRIVDGARFEPLFISAQRAGLGPAATLRVLAMGAIAVQCLSSIAFALANRHESAPFPARARAALWALPPLAFHLGVRALDLEVGWFTETLVLITGCVFVPHELPRAAVRWLGALDARLRPDDTPFARTVFALLGLGFLPLAWFTVDLPGAGAASLVVLACTALAAGLNRALSARDLPMAWVLTAALTSFVLRHPSAGPFEASTVRYDYYRFVGGDRRRRGETAEAEVAYRKALRYAPDAIRANRVRAILARLHS